MAESLATFVGRGMNKAKPKPAPAAAPTLKPKPAPLPGYPTRKGLDEPTIWGGGKTKPLLGGSLASMLGRR